MKVNLTRSFERDLRRISAQDRTSVIEAIGKFVRSPSSKGLNFETVRSRRGYHSIRATLSVRILLLETGKQEYDVVAVGNHDYIYRSFFKS